ncbi:MAG: hypothetical protein ABSB25_09650 [Sedimentisphaerales bacterium]
MTRRQACGLNIKNPCNPFDLVRLRSPQVAQGRPCSPFDLAQGVLCGRIFAIDKQ